MNEYNYERPSVTVDIAVCSIIDKELKVLLIQRDIEPYLNEWAIPGGFVSIERKESLEDAARRKLREETGMEGVFLEQLKTYGDPFRDPRMRVITIAYYALIPFSKIKSFNIEHEMSTSSGWFSLNALPEHLAFDHSVILKDLLVRIQGKIMYTPIAFSLVDKHFTWSELQEIYEIILGKKLITPNFRRKLLSMYTISELEQVKRTKGRPSKYLVFEGEKEF
jgi:8-oxo-dGTP diphosphatase